MNSRHLLPDELLVECIVRGIKGHPTDVLKALNEAWQLEGQFPPFRPSQMHSTAATNTSRELNRCITRLVELQSQLAELSDSTQAEYLTIKSRLLHIEGRLFRACSSFKYEAEANKILKLCQKMIVSVDNFLSKKTNFNTTMECLKYLKIGELKFLPDNDEEDEPLPHVFEYLAAPIIDTQRFAPVASDMAVITAPTETHNISPQIVISLPESSTESDEVKGKCSVVGANKRDKQIPYVNTYRDHCRKLRIRQYWSRKRATKKMIAQTLLDGSSVSNIVSVDKRS